MQHLLLLLISLGLALVGAAPPVPAELDATYTFDQYVSDFNKLWEQGTGEWSSREEIFQRNLDQILEHNLKFFDTTKNPERRGHFLGVNQFTDLEESEMAYGFDKAANGVAFGVATSRSLEGVHEMKIPFLIEDVSTLPKEKDWRKEGVVTPVKDQGYCGSCWAFATAQTLESHIAIETGTLYTLSPQEILACVPNPRKCGGPGGCGGGTVELALDYVATKKHGIVEEWQMGYTSYHGEVEKCSIEDAWWTGTHLRGSEEQEFGPDPGGISGAVATIDGYSVLPTNDYAAMMNAVAKHSPVAVAVAASTWQHYAGGVLSDDHIAGSFKHTINHAVQVVGYGTDEKTGEDYWLIRNTWKPTWGEFGYIRIKREDPNTLPDPKSICGMDTNPSKGIACTKDENQNPIAPPAVEVCGTSGVLFDGVVAVGGRLL